MIVLAILAFGVNAVAVGWSLFLAGDSIRQGANPTLWFLLTIAFIVTIAFLGQFIAMQPEEQTAHADATH